MIRKLLQSLGVRSALPPDEAGAVERARGAFASKYPDEPVIGARVRALEADRIIVAVRYGRGRPGSTRYWAIARPSLAVLGELPAAEWWPRGVK